MRIYYRESRGRQNVPSAVPVDESIENTLEIFRGLSSGCGFIGILLKEPFVLQMMRRKAGVQIELLDSSIPAADICERVDSSLAEQLIRAAASGQDVFRIARQAIPRWAHIKMG